jgi:hypothetical protein
MDVSAAAAPVGGALPSIVTASFATCPALARADGGCLLPGKRSAYPISAHRFAAAIPGIATCAGSGKRPVLMLLQP